MAKWDFLKSRYPKMPVDANYAQKMDVILDTAVEGYDLTLRQLPDHDLKNVYLEKRDMIDAMTEQIKALNTEVEAITKLMVERMEETEQASVTFEDGVSLGHTVEPYPFVEDQGRMLDWVRRNGLESMLTLNYQTMASLVKERLEGKVNEPLPDGVGVFMKDKLSCRGRKKAELQRPGAQTAEAGSAPKGEKQ